MVPGMPQFQCSVCDGSFDVSQSALDKFPGWEPKYCRQHSPKRKAAPSGRKSSGGGKARGGACAKNDRCTRDPGHSGRCSLQTVPTHAGDAAPPWGRRAF